MNAMVGKRHIDVEKLLHWTYRDELPKRGAEWGGRAAFSSGFSGQPRVDDWSRDPGFPVALGPPHPDACLVEEAVHRLAILEMEATAELVEFCLPACGLVDPADIRLRALEVDPVPLVAAHARMGNRPEWRSEPPRPGRIIGANGHVVVHGLGSNRAYKIGAACPLEWWPDPAAIVADRVSYYVWHVALGELVAALSDSLERWIPLPPAASPCPWTVPDEKIRVLADLRSPAISVPRPALRARRRLDWTVPGS